MGGNNIGKHRFKIQNTKEKCSIGENEPNESRIWQNYENRLKVSMAIKTN
jgi:hypothetical protein